MTQHRTNSIREGLPHIRDGSVDIVPEVISRISIMEGRRSDLRGKFPNGRVVVVPKIRRGANVLDGSGCNCCLSPRTTTERQDAKVVLEAGVKI